MIWARAGKQFEVKDLFPLPKTGKSSKGKKEKSKKGKKLKKLSAAERVTACESYLVMAIMHQAVARSDPRGRTMRTVPARHATLRMKLAAYFSLVPRSVL